jgi:cytoskeletal protein RodZ
MPLLQHHQYCSANLLNDGHRTISSSSHGECAALAEDGNGHGHDFSFSRASRQSSMMFLISTTVTVRAFHVLLCALLLMLLLLVGVHGEAEATNKSAASSISRIVSTKDDVAIINSGENENESSTIPAIRHLQMTSTTTTYSSDKVIEVLDMDVNYPDPLLDDYQTHAVQCNGVIFTVKNLSQKENEDDEPMNMNLFGLEVYMNTNNDGDVAPVTLQVYARSGENNVNPLQDVSTEWIVLKELGDIILDSDVDGEFVSIVLKVSYVIPANSAVTLFVFVEQSASIMTRHETDDVANQNENKNGRASIQSGTAIQTIPGHEDPWTAFPNNAFLGNVLCEFPNAPPTMDMGVGSSQDNLSLVTMNLLSVWAPGDVPARTYGIAAFDVFSETGCNITSLDIHTPVTTYMVVEVYTKQDSSFQDMNIMDDKEWHLTSKIGVKGLGQTKTTAIPYESFETVVVKPNSIVAIYITTTQVEVVSITTLEKIGNAVEGATIDSTWQNQNQDTDTSLGIRVGQTVTKYPVLSNDAYPMGLASPQALGHNVIFSGKIHYELPPTFSPTPSPTSTDQMDLNPELISQLKLTIKGIDRRTLRRLQKGNGTMMTNDDIRRYFEWAGQSFIKQLVNTPGQPSIDVRRFVVSPVSTKTM